MSNGEPFDPTNPHNAAAVYYPLGSVLQIRFGDAILYVRVTDGMPPNGLGRTVDLTRAGADALGTRRLGVARVSILLIY